MSRFLFYDDVWISVGWMLWDPMVVRWLEREKETIEGDWGELAKDPSTIMSFFSLGLKLSRCMNGKKRYLRLMGLGPFYREFLSGSTYKVSLTSWVMCGLMGSVERISGIHPMSWNSGMWSDYFMFVENPLKFSKCWMVVHAFLWHGWIHIFILCDATSQLPFLWVNLDLFWSWTTIMDEWGLI